jgi:hypothetical protein
MLWIPSGLRRLLFCSSSDAGIDYARAVPNKIAVWGSFLTHLDLIAWEFSRSRDRSETLGETSNILEKAPILGACDAPGSSGK